MGNTDLQCQYLYFFLIQKLLDGIEDKIKPFIKLILVVHISILIVFKLFFRYLGPQLDAHIEFLNGFIRLIGQR